MTGLLFLAAACFALAALCTVALDKVPGITGTVAFIVTLAALGLAYVR